MIKKLIVILCAATAIFVCLSCQPTPAEDVVVNRGESGTWGGAQPGDSAAPEAIPTADLLSIPQKLTLTEQPQKNVIVSIDAPVLLARDAAYPIIEVLPYDTLHDAGLINRLLQSVCPGGTVYEPWERTKAEVAEQLEAALAYHGQGGSVVDKDLLDNTYIPRFEEEYQNAPEVADKVRHDVASGFESGQYYFVELPDGGTGRLQFRSGNSMDFMATERMMYCNERFIQEGDAPLAEPEISEEEAIRIGDEFLRGLGIECTALAGVEKGFSFYNYERQESIYLLNYLRKIGEAYSLDMERVVSWHYAPGYDFSSTLGAPWQPESAYLAVSPDGVIYASFEGLSRTSQVLEEDSALCDFARITDRIVEQLGFQYAGNNLWAAPMFDDNGNAIMNNLQVKNIELIYALVCQKDRVDVGVYIPVWEITYYRNDDTIPQQLYLSALDGGTVDPRLTWENLLSLAEKRAEIEAQMAEEAAREEAAKAADDAA